MKSTKKKSKKGKNKVQQGENFTFTKKILVFVLINALLQIWASYILAFFDKVEIAQELSIQTTITIVGTIVGYMIKSCVENLSKHGVFTQKTQKSICDTSEFNAEQEESDLETLNEEEVQCSNDMTLQSLDELLISDGIITQEEIDNLTED